MIEKLKPLLKLIAVPAVAMIAGVLVFHFLASPEAKPPPEVNYERSPTTGARFVVPEDRVPQTQDERRAAAALTLIPDHLETQPTEAAVPEATKRVISASVLRFLARWETFNGGAIYLNQLRHGQNNYLLGLQPLISPEQRDSVLGRTDSVDPEGVCPSRECPVSSEWLGVGGPDAITIVDYSGAEAYVTLTGLVHYGGSSDISAVGGQTRWRSYGLLLKESGVQWLVERVAAETLSYGPGG